MLPNSQTLAHRSKTVRTNLASAIGVHFGKVPPRFQHTHSSKDKNCPNVAEMQSLPNIPRTNPVALGHLGEAIQSLELTQSVVIDASANFQPLQQLRLLLSRWKDAVGIVHGEHR